eukprot:8857135-Alexandrium_andersonii.AAC.1
MPPAQEALVQANVTWPMQRAVHVVNGNPSTLTHWLRPPRQEEQSQQRGQAVQRAIAELACTGEVKAYDVSDDEASAQQPAPPPPPLHQLFTFLPHPQPMSQPCGSLVAEDGHGKKK